MKKVILLATGGTIAGTGEAGKSTGYDSGTLTAEDLLSAVPQLAQVADVEAVQVCNVNSDDITDRLWLKLLRTIHVYAADPNVAGFVVTHGTDTLEETAYFLNLTVKTEKPVVLTGSMRPATAISPDGPMNLYQAVCVAASSKAVGKGVLAVFADQIYDARTVAKRSTYHVMAIGSGELGALGVLRDDKVFFYQTLLKPHTVHTEFSVENRKDLPRVSIAYFAVDADPRILTDLAKYADGLVIAGAGAGEFSERFKEVIETLSLPVVVSSRIDDGILTQEGMLCSNTVAADHLSPQKAAVLLRLALTKTTDTTELVRIFQTY